MGHRSRIVKPWRFTLFITIVVLLVLGTLTAILFKPVKKEVEIFLYPLRYFDLIQKYAAEYDLSESLLCAVIKCESSFQPDAVSSIGARGLMQITGDTFDWVKGRLGGDETYDDMFDPETAVRYGAYLLSYLKTRFPGDAETLAAYHAGLNQVQRWLDDPQYSADGVTLDTVPFDDTRHYISKVTDTMAMYQQLYDLR